MAGSLRPIPIKNEFGNGESLTVCLANYNMLYATFVQTCCIVMPAGTVLLFYRNHFIDLYCHLFIPIRVTLELCHAGQRNISKNSVYTCLPRPAESPGVQRLST